MEGTLNSPVPSLPLGANEAASSLEAAAALAVWFEPLLFSAWCVVPE